MTTTSTESVYFVDASAFRSTLHSSGWKEAEMSDERTGTYDMYKFWKQTWKQQNQTRALEIPKGAVPASPCTPTTFPTFKKKLPFALERDEYKKLYDWLYTCDLADEAVERQAVAITGHLGIGKRVFGIYVLYRRCVDGIPTLYYDSPTRRLLLFHEDGVEYFDYQAHTPTSLLHLFTAKTWLVVDGSLPVPVPYFLILPEACHPRIILTAPPSYEAEWKSWIKIDIDVFVLYMQGWDDYELQHGYENQAHV